MLSFGGPSSLNTNISTLFGENAPKLQFVTQLGTATQLSKLTFQP